MDEKDKINVVGISDEDIRDAFKELKTYIDISPEDFKEIYMHALKHAVKRLTCGKAEVVTLEKRDCKE